MCKNINNKGCPKNLCQQSVCGKRAEGVLCYVCQKKRWRKAEGGKKVKKG